MNTLNTQMTLQAILSSYSLLQLFIENITCEYPGHLTVHDCDDIDNFYYLKVANDKGCLFSIQFLNTPITLSKINQIAYSGSRLIYENIGEYQHYVQIILSDTPHQNTLVEAYMSRNSDGQCEGHLFNTKEDNALLIRYYVYLPYIDIMIVEKGIENFNEFELLIYVIRHVIDKKSLMTKNIIDINTEKLYKVSPLQSMFKTNISV